MSYICRDCEYHINGAPPNPPRCPSCGSMYLLQDQKKLQKLNAEIRRLAHLRKSKQEPITFYDRVFSSIFVVFVAAMTLIFGPFLSMFVSGRSASMEMIMREYQFIVEWWPSMLFGAAIIGFIFDIDKIANFFGFVWGTVKENEEIIMVLVLFVVSAMMFAYFFQ